MNRQALGMVSLCMRAGRIVSGEQAVLTAIRRGTARLVILDASASANTKKMFGDSCAYYGVERVEAPEEALGTAIGKPGRKVAAVTDEGFAASILKLTSREA